MSSRDEKIDSFLTEHQSRFIQELSELCAQPSVSARKEGVHECGALVAKILERHHLAVQSIPTPDSPVIVGRASGDSPRTLLLYNHYDVQPPEPLELWTTPPYQPTLRDGALYARGAEDDKGELIARLAALEAVRYAHGGNLPCGVTFVVEGQEEIGSPYMADFVQNHLDLLKSQATIWEGGGISVEGNPGSVLGLRGVLSVEIVVQTMSQDAHSGIAHALPSAAWRLVRVLACIKDEYEHILIPGFYEHALPPTDYDLELINASPDMEAWFKEHFGVRQFVNDLHGKDLEKAVFNPTCNIQGITTGYQGAGMKTVIPARASTKVDFRLVPDQDPKDIFAKLRRHLDQSGFEDVSLTWLGAMWPFKAPADNPFVKLTARTAEAVYGKPFEMFPLVGGSSPVYAFAKPLGNIPVVMAGTGYAQNNAHAPDEHIRLVDFQNGARHIARILDGFADLP